MLRHAWDGSGYVKNLCYLPDLHRRQSQRPTGMRHVQQGQRRGLYRAPSESIPNAASVGSDGLYAVKIRFDDTAVAEKLSSLDSGGSAAIYIKYGKPVHV